MLIVGLRLPVIDTVHPEQVLGSPMELGFGIVTHETNRGTGGTDSILQGLRDLLLRSHWVPQNMSCLHANIDLHHSGTSMSRDSIISSWGVTEEGISGNPFIPAPDIGCREPGLEVLSEGVVHNTTIVLGCLVQHLLDLLIGGPSKVGLQGVEMREPTA